jgi:hypothetical protein
MEGKRERNCATTEHRRARCLAVHRRCGAWLAGRPELGVPFSFDGGAGRAAWKAVAPAERRARVLEDYAGFVVMPSPDRPSASSTTGATLDARLSGLPPSAGVLRRRRPTLRASTGRVD